MDRSPARRRGARAKAPVAFVLSGGGSLGAVQVGMLQALTETGVRPDMLIGTSVGAVNAAWMAAHPDHDGAVELGEIWLGMRRQNVFPLSPWAGARGLLGRSNHFISNASLRTLLERHIPYARLEDAAVPVHIITTELKTGRGVVLSSGPTIPALLASTAIPGVFPPVTVGRRDLIDGGIANHTPITTAIELGASEIYVLPVGYPWMRQEPTNALSMALYALARFVEQKLDAEVAMHRHLADIHVMPTLDLPAVSPADFSQTSELIARGQKWARRYLGSAAPPPQPETARASRPAPIFESSPARAA
ncbi:MAG TPA: patatin-like phospholipase family protein [Candidatus Baltobacterales bacterium]|nr:patatin-like phospholipase family protein [Candidatus Baltobacterales bacterium]